MGVACGHESGVSLTLGPLRSPDPAPGAVKTEEREPVRSPTATLPVSLRTPEKLNISLQYG